MKKGKKEPLITVIIPVYNVSRYLKTTIESIIAQDYKNIEIILVNDGSEDNSGEICDEYKNKDDRIIVYHKKNEGVSKTRNYGIDRANGDFICFVDGDDILEKDYVSYLYKLINENPQADISLTTLMFSNFDSKQVEHDKIEIWDSETATESILCYRVPIGCYCKLFKKEFLNNNKIRFRKELFIGEGFNFNVDSFQKATTIVKGSRKIYYYRRDNEMSATTKFSEKKWVNGLFALDIMYENFTIKTKKIEKAWKYAKWRTSTDAYDVIVLANAQNESKELFKKCKKNIRSGFFKSLSVPVSAKDRLRAFAFMVSPSIIPLAMKYRKKKYIK